MEIQIGRRIRELREAKGLSQAALAQELGVSPVTVYRWESGAREISLTLLGQVAAVLDAEPSDFFPKAQAPLFPLEEERRAQELGQQWADDIRTWHAYHENLLQNQIDLATTLKEKGAVEEATEVRERAPKVFNAAVIEAASLLSGALHYFPGVNVPELEEAFDTWSERLREFRQTPSQKAVPPGLVKQIAEIAKEAEIIGRKK